MAADYTKDSNKKIPGAPKPQSLCARRLNTFRLKSTLKEFYSVRSEKELLEVLRCIEQEPLILGRGSNLVLASSGISRPVIQLAGDFDFVTGLDETVDEDVHLIEVGAATSLMNLSRKTCSLGLSGLEFAAGIPASLGGALRMNAGAHGNAMEDVVRSVDLLTFDAEKIRLESSDIQFRYRGSDIPSNSVLLSAKLALRPSSPEEVKDKRNSCLSYRKETQPLELPSAGSVFKNPSPVGGGREAFKSAGALIEALGLKGFSWGGVRVSEKHGNWIVKGKGPALGEEVKELISKIVQEARDKEGIHLHPEVIFWGFD